VVVRVITPDESYIDYEADGEAFVLAVGHTEGPTRVVGEVVKDGPLWLRLRLVDCIDTSAADWR
jgi:hypothetical protein